MTWNCSQILVYLFRRGGIKIISKIIQLLLLVTIRNTGSISYLGPLLHYIHTCTHIETQNTIGCCYNIMKFSVIAHILSLGYRYSFSQRCPFYIYSRTRSRLNIFLIFLLNNIPYTPDTDPLKTKIHLAKQEHLHHYSSLSGV